MKAKNRWRMINGIKYLTEMETLAGNESGSPYKGVDWSEVL